MRGDLGQSMGRERLRRVLGPGSTSDGHVFMRGQTRVKADDIHLVAGTGWILLPHAGAGYRPVCPLPSFREDTLGFGYVHTWYPQKAPQGRSRWRASRVDMTWRQTLWEAQALGEDWRPMQGRDQLSVWAAAGKLCGFVCSGPSLL